MVLLIRFFLIKTGMVVVGEARKKIHERIRISIENIALLQKFTILQRL